MRERTIASHYARAALGGARRAGYDYSGLLQQVGITPELLLYAKIDLLTYGWWNCVNNSIRRVQPTDDLHQQFTRLFASVTSECDDVD